MSDVQQGPDWWMASDLKWYPPNAASLPPPPTGMRSPLQSSGLPPGLSTGLQVLLWVAGGMAAVAALLSLGLLGASSDFETSPSLDSLRAWSDLEDAAGGFGSLLSLMMIAVLVLFIVWGFRAHRASGLLSPVGRTWGRGWTIGAWFVPVANLIIPFLVTSETQRIAMAERRGGVVDPRWRTNSRTTSTGYLWWICQVGYWIGSLGAGAVLGSEPWDARDLGPVQGAYFLQAAASVLLAGSGVFGALYVRSIGRLLSPQDLARR